MKAALLFLTVSLFSLTEIEAQHLASVDSNKYRINLPDYWKPGQRIWRILSDKLPEVCEDIRDKELCGDDCNPWLRIEFEMSAPIILDYLPNHISSNYANNQLSRPSDIWDIQTTYVFEASLLLMDNNNKIITRFILVDTDEVWRHSNRITLPSYAPTPPPIYNIRRTTPNRSGTISDPIYQQLAPASGQEGITPFSYINKNKEKLAPSLKDLLAVIDTKIASW